LKSPRGVFGDVFVESPGDGACLEDALYGVVVEGAETSGVCERGIEVLRLEAGAQDEDTAGVMGPDARRPGAHQAEERGAALTDAVEGAGELVEIESALAPRRRVETLGIDHAPRATGSELVTSNALEVGTVDDELALGDAHGEQIGDVVVADGVPVALPIDEAIDAADAVSDLRRVVGVAR